MTRPYDTYKDQPLQQMSHPIASRHLEDYVLVNTADGSTWRATWLPARGGWGWIRNEKTALVLLPADGIRELIAVQVPLWTPPTPADAEEHN